MGAVAIKFQSVIILSFAVFDANPEQLRYHIRNAEHIARKILHI